MPTLDREIACLPACLPACHTPSHGLLSNTHVSVPTMRINVVGSQYVDPIPNHNHGISAILGCVGALGLHVCRQEGASFALAREQTKLDATIFGFD